jgi:c-di-GMP-binding flagellar brake protein YcgR
MKERRRFKRYTMPRGTFAILRNELEQLNNHRQMSIGEIAMVLYKSEAQMVGQVANMSLGGMAFQSDRYHLPAVSEIELDLLMTEKGIYLHNIPFALVPKSAVKKTKKQVDSSQRAALRFKKLGPTLKKELRELMAHHIG